MIKLMLSIPAGLMVLGTMMPALGQLDRYPTAQEMPSLIRQFQQNILSLKDYPDRRSPADRQKLIAFKQAWAKVDPVVVPFLGEWTAIEESKLIYPSSTPGKVCILDTFIDGEGTGLTFAIGTVANGQVRASDRTLLIQQDNFLGSIFVYEGKPSVYEYMNPRSLQDPATVSYLRKNPRIIQQFQQAGCTAKWPK